MSCTSTTAGNWVCRYFRAAYTDSCRTSIWTSTPPPTVIIELNVIGNELRGYAWRPGESKPAEPQISAFDNSFSSGKAGIAYDEDDDNTTGVFRWVMAQDTPFVDMVPGDFNTDGTVDAADYVFWRDRLGNPFTQEDYNVWRANFDAVSAGAGSGAVNTSVPEPMSILPILIAIIGLVPVARARRRDSPTDIETLEHRAKLTQRREGAKSSCE